MSTRTNPQTPEELLNRLFVIFPRFRNQYDGSIRDQSSTYHSVFMAFTPFFGSELASFSQAQLRSFGELINEAVKQNDVLENALGTCLLEHLHQIKAEHVLKPHLSKIAREKTRA